MQNIIIRFARLALGLAVLWQVQACGPKAAIPADSQPTQEQAAIYPDYRDIVIPPNIAPLNIQVTSEGDAFVGCIAGGGMQILAAAGADGKLEFDAAEWRKLLEQNKGKDLAVTLYSCRGGQWLKHPAYSLHVAPEEIDRYLFYRLIEPSYELYRQLGIYQRDLTTFEEKAVYENNRSFDSINNHCINCHNFQNYDAGKRMLFHVRAAHGGTVFVEDGKVTKMNMNCDSVLSSSVYPSWHPRRNWVVFSSNQTGQTFHVVNHQKVEVVDFGSDLIFYDADAHTLTNILKTSTDLETFPCWSPDGKRLFYCCASVPGLAGKNTLERSDYISAHYDSIRYNLMSMPFDEKTRRFGPPQLEMDCAAVGKSATVPRVSPDGRYVLFTLGDYGQFHIWHKSSDLYVKDLQTGQIRALAAANSPDVDTYHTWSSNGRWIIVASRRDDGSYTRLYIAYFDRQGKDHKAFLLPQLDPEYNLLLMKSYNIPELSRTPVQVSEETLRRVIYDDKAAGRVSYKP